MRIDAPSARTRIIAPVGELDAHTAPDLRAAIDETLAVPDLMQLVVDLSETSFLDSSALGVLVVAFKRMRARDGRLDVVVSAAAPIRRIFRITALDDALDLHETRSRALAALDAVPRPPVR